MTATNKEIKKALEDASYTKNGKTFKYSKSTISGYITKFNKVKDMTFQEIVDKYEHMSNGYLSAVLTISRNVKSLEKSKAKQDELLDLIEKSNVKARNIAYNKTKTTASITLDDIKNKRDTFPKDSQDYLLLSFYLDFPIRDDFAEMRIVKRKPKYNTGNYINISKTGSAITLNEYKTKNIYGSKTFKVPKPLRELVLESLKNEPRKFLFTSNQNKPYKEGLSDKILKKFGFSINEIRRAHINNLLETTEHSLTDRENLGKKMLSSPIQQSFTYKRLKK
tara:strand:+ start:106 stop:942 length:837 start_codon:yes stop_codon:yes gene_type:complete